jgi:signal peptidase II
MNLGKRYRLPALLGILLVCVGCDQVTKQVARAHLPDAGRQSFLGDTVRLEYAENPGAFLSLGSDWPEVFRVWLLPVITAGMLAGLCTFLLVRSRLPRAEFLGLSLILGGGAGNLIDRLLRDGHVTDFLNLGVGSVRTGIFNVADAAITAGALLVLAVAFGLADRPKTRTRAGTDPDPSGA